MSRPTLYCAITNHGFGHATRLTAVAAEVQRRCPDVLIILTTTAPRWLLESYLPGDFILRPRAYDVGVVQPNSLTMDLAATLTQLQQLRDRAPQIIAREVEYLWTNEVDLILGDIPPLAASIGAAAKIPVWMMGNFGWDFIYRHWGGEFTAIADWIGDCFGQCDRLFRLPFHDPMAAFSKITDVGLTGGTPRYTPAELASRFNLMPDRKKTLLLTFGGLGIQQIPYNKIRDYPHWQFITFDRNAPDLPNLLCIRDRQCRPVDLMPLCDRVISKPGFSTFSEAIRLNVPIVSLQRDGFAETPLLMQGLQQYSEHKILESERFFQGDWDVLEQPLDPPQSSHPIACNGTEIIATAILEHLLP
jgi:hypothetical protein